MASIREMMKSAVLTSVKTVTPSVSTSICLAALTHVVAGCVAVSEALYDCYRVTVKTMEPVWGLGRWMPNLGLGEWSSKFAVSGLKYLVSQNKAIKGALAVYDTAMTVYKDGFSAWTLLSGGYSTTQCAFFALKLATYVPKLSVYFVQNSAHLALGCSVGVATSWTASYTMAFLLHGINKNLEKKDLEKKDLEKKLFEQVKVKNESSVEVIKNLEKITKEIENLKAWETTLKSGKYGADVLYEVSLGGAKYFVPLYIMSKVKDAVISALETFAAGGEAAVGSEVNGLNTTIAAQSATIQQQSSIIHQKDITIQQKDTLIHQQDQTLVNQVKEHSVQIAATQVQTQALSTEYVESSSLQARVQKQATQLGQQAQELLDNTQLIENLKTEVSGKDKQLLGIKLQLFFGMKLLISMDKTIGGLKEELSTLQGQLSVKEKEGLAKDVELSDLSKQVLTKTQEMEKLKVDALAFGKKLFFVTQKTVQGLQTKISEHSKELSSLQTQVKVPAKPLMQSGPKLSGKESISKSIEDVSIELSGISGFNHLPDMSSLWSGLSGLCSNIGGSLSSLNPIGALSLVDGVKGLDISPLVPPSGGGVPLGVPLVAEVPELFSQ